MLNMNDLCVTFFFSRVKRVLIKLYIYAQFALSSLRCLDQYQRENVEVIE